MRRVWGWERLRREAGFAGHVSDGSGGHREVRGLEDSQCGVGCGRVDGCAPHREKIREAGGSPGEGQTRNQERTSLMEQGPDWSSREVQAECGERQRTHTDTSRLSLGARREGEKHREGYPYVGGAAEGGHTGQVQGSQSR